MMLKAFAYRFVLPAMAAAMVFAASDARAEDSVRSTATAPASAEEGETVNERSNPRLWSTEKKLVVFSAFGAAAVSLGVSWFSFIKSRNASQTELDEFPYGDCATIAACDRLRSLVHDDKMWMDRGVALTAVGLGLVAGTTVMALLLPNGKTTISPSASASKDGASFSLGGRF